MGSLRSAALTNANVFDLKEPPQRLAILGGGPIGCELAFAFAGFGVEVTVLEMSSRLLPRDEPEASAVARRTLESRGAKVHTDTTVSSASSTATGTRVLSASVRSVGPDRTSSSHETVVEADEILIAAGRSPVTDGLRAERAGVLINHRGAIAVDDTMATTASGIWAIGDVTGGMAFTHAAGAMALVRSAMRSLRVSCPADVSTPHRSHGSRSSIPRSHTSA